MKTAYDDLIQRAVKKHLKDYDWRLLKAQYWQESKLDPEAVSPAGAVGVAQFMPKTWTQWAKKAGYAGAKRTDPEASIFTGALYMNYLIGQWSWPRPVIDRHCLAMASYNAGLGNILKAQKLSGNKSLYAEIIKHLPQVTGKKSKETMGYVTMILNYWAQAVTEP